ncbi:MAG TPA: Sec-independent protein translocase subunit TatB [Epsilonproteobacteria bacterium]|nr:Sec-independent protein translocase subunit TatB [Campylobacterota bacterium]
MFGLGFTEILLIAVVAILFLGPDKLPDAMVKVAKFIKSVKKAVSDAKSSLDEEMKIADLKEEALSYKKQLDEATNELSAFKNVGINPIDDIKEAISGASKSFSEAAGEAQKSTIATQVEPKQETVTFKKKKKKENKAQKQEKKGGDE